MLLLRTAENRKARRTRRWRIGTAFAVGLCLQSLFYTPAILANGWEHLAIPRQALLKALQSGDDHAMAHAAVSLGVRREAKDVMPLLAALELAADSPGVRSEIYTALGMIGDVRALPRLVEALESEPREELRAAAAVALGEIGAPEGLPHLLYALETEAPRVRLRVVDALGAFAHTDSVAALAGLLDDRPDSPLELRALQALGRTGAKSAAEPLLQALARTQNDRALAIIIDALAKIASPLAVEPLTDLLAETDDPVLRVKTAAALGAVADEGVLATLTDLLEDDSQAVRAAAVRQLTEAKAPETAPPLLELYRQLAAQRPPHASPEQPDDPLSYVADLDLMLLTVRALLETDPRVGLDAFIDGAKHRNFRRDSAIGLKLARKSYELRRLSVTGLGYTNAAPAAEVLRRYAMEEPNHRIRAAAVRSLGVLGEAGAFKVVLHALTDEHPEVRLNAAAVLGRLGDPRAVPGLIERLRDPHAEVRVQAAASLGFLDDPRAIAPLERLERDAHQAKVRETARQALLLLADDNAD